MEISDHGAFSFEDDELIFDEASAAPPVPPPSAAGARWASALAFYDDRVASHSAEALQYLGDEFKRFFPPAAGPPAAGPPAAGPPAAGPPAADARAAGQPAADALVYNVVACAVLATCAWRLDAAVENFLADPDRCLREAQLSPAAGPPVPPVGRVCPILDDPCDAMLANSLCGHWASPRAWELYIRGLDHPLRGARCMFCTKPLGGDLIAAAAGSTVLEIWRQRVVEDYISQTKVAHCPSVDCPGLLESSRLQRFVALASKHLPDASALPSTAEVAATREYVRQQERTCTFGSPMHCVACSLYMCSTCGNESHTLWPCEMICDWNYENENESQNALWLMVHTKNCPACLKPIEKDKGCMHMTCKCGHQFCWLCLDVWSKHDNVYRCNFYVESGGQDIYSAQTDGSACHQEKRRDDLDQSQRKLARYTYYFGRYISHQRGAQMDALTASLKAIEVRQTQKNDSHNATAPPLFFAIMHKAINTIVAGRNLLKYTYVFAYYADWADENAKLLFYDQQGQMERALDTLQEIIENYWEQLEACTYEDYIMRVSDITRVLDEYLDRMKGAFSKELIQKHSLYRIAPTLADPR